MVARIAKVALSLLVLSVVQTAAIAEDPPALPYNIQEIRDPATLEIKVARDWRVVRGDLPSRQKAIEITLCEWMPGRKVRVPVVLVAPETGGPFPFIISSIGLAGTQVRLDDLAKDLLPRGVGFVHVGIGRIDQMEPAEVLADEMNEHFIKTHDPRYTPAWIWGMTYMRAVTAALTEDKVFKAGKIGATGGSKRGLASASAGTWDDRITCIVPMVAPVFAQPERNEKYAELDEEYLRLAEKGKTELAVAEVARLRAIRENKSRFWLGDEDFLAAGWTRQDIDEADRRVGQMHLALFNAADWDRRGLDYFFQIGTNDNVTPRAVQLYKKYPRFSAYIVPGGQHGTDEIGNQKRTPTLPDVKANSLAVFSNHFFGDRPRLKTPRLTYQRKGDRLKVRVAFDEGPVADSGTLWWTTNRPPEGSLPYEHSSWNSAEMKPADKHTWAGQIQIPPGTKSVDLVSVHTDTVNDMPMHVSSPWVRVVVE